MPGVVDQPTGRATADVIAKAVAERHHAAAGQRDGAADIEVGAQAGRGERHRPVVGDRAHQRREAVGRADELTAAGNRHAVERSGFLNGAPAGRRDDASTRCRQRAVEDRRVAPKANQAVLIGYKCSPRVGQCATIQVQGPRRCPACLTISAFVPPVVMDSVLAPFTTTVSALVMLRIVVVPVWWVMVRTPATSIVTSSAGWGRRGIAAPVGREHSTIDRHQGTMRQVPHGLDLLLMIK